LAAVSLRARTAPEGIVGELGPAVPLGTDLDTSVITGDVVEEVTRLKKQVDGDIQVPGSIQLVQELTRMTIDEIHLMTFPVILGTGRRLFGETTDKKTWKLAESKTVGEGIPITIFQRQRTLTGLATLGAAEGQSRPTHGARGAERWRQPVAARHRIPALRRRVPNSGERRLAGVSRDAAVAPRDRAKRERAGRHIRRSLVVPSERLAKAGGNARSSRKAGVTGAAGTHAAGTIPLEDCGDHR
jgi:hypothetical protein